MKKNEIEVGGLYVAKVSGKLTVVRVTEIREVAGFKPTSLYSGRSARPATTVYDVINTKTGRGTTFRSAAKFRLSAKQPTA